ncbi:MAG: SDR family NAD(P)-dependent oxidoreductase, partial [Cyclobacteriaceae bacterium]|nr:SDR family NAD(P)-dependent oxidoreductase [Cyclobacteriaceae bacterium]
MDLQLKNKVFIVTGGAKGIGEAITRELVNEGAIPVIAGRSEHEAHQLAEWISSVGGQCLTLVTELTNEGSCKAIVEATWKKFGRIDGIVNNAGVNDGAGLEKGPEAFRASIHLNLFHYYDLVHFALPYLKES